MESSGWLLNSNSVTSIGLSRVWASRAGRAPERRNTCSEGTTRTFQSVDLLNVAEVVDSGVSCTSGSSEADDLGNAVDAERGIARHSQDY